jgi:creatinine amidohydrolase
MRIRSAYGYAVKMLLTTIGWTDLKSIAEKLFIVPLGSLEQHGHHLPLFTDTCIVSEVATHVEALLASEVVLLPTQWLGHSPHHRQFGSVSLDFFPYVEMIRGICRSLIGMGARKILLLNGHGGNDIPCKAAQRELKSEFADLHDLYIVYAAYWNLAAEEFTNIRESPVGGMGHACEMETSVMLAAQPALVDMTKARTDGPGPHMGYRPTDMLHPLPFSLISEFNEISASGVIGMPESATAQKGERFLKAAEKAVVALVKEMQGWTFQGS